MHVVECPGCGRKFRVPGPVVRRQVTCGRCGASFVGSSVEAPDMAGAGFPPLPAPGAAPAAAPVRRARTSSSSAGPVMLVVSIVALIGIVALGVTLLLTLTGSVKPSPIVRIEDRPQPPPRRPARARPLDPRAADNGRTPAPPAATPTAARPPVAAPVAPKSDPTLDAGWSVVAPGAIGEELHVAGRVRNRSSRPLKSVTVTAYVRGMEGPSRTYRFVPPNGHILYSMLIGGKGVTDDEVRVVARGVPAEAGTLIWQIPSSELNRTQSGDRYVWTGRTRNPFDTAVTDVKVYLDYFDDKGIQYGSAPPGGLEEGESIGAGKRAFFRVTSTDFKAGGAREYVARAVARPY